MGSTRIAPSRQWLHVTPLLLLAALVGWAQDPPNPAPCSAPEHRQFDFWVGEWNVTTPDGERAGVNKIEKILDGCALRESWVGSGGMRGHSLNIYSASSGTWHQTWVDTNGMLLGLDGGLRSDTMVLAGTTLDKDGKTTIHHEISWQQLDDGRVRQHWRTSSDGGATWNDAFIGLYEKKE